MCFADCAFRGVDGTPRHAAGLADQRTRNALLCHVAGSSLGPGTARARGGAGQTLVVYITTRTALGPFGCPISRPAGAAAVTRAHVLTGQAQCYSRPPTAEAGPWATCLWGGQPFPAPCMVQVQLMWVCPNGPKIRVKFDKSKKAANGMAVHGAVGGSLAATAQRRMVARVMQK